MPQLIMLGLAGAGLYAGWRWLAREFQRAIEAADRAEAEATARTAAPRDLGKLEWDPEAGVYRPSRSRREL
jgi:hypothetical protein